MYACGEGTNGRLGLGHSNNVSAPRQITALAQYVVKKVAVHSGGKVMMMVMLRLDLIVLFSTRWL